MTFKGIFINGHGLRLVWLMILTLLGSVALVVMLYNRTAGSDVQNCMNAKKDWVFDHTAQVSNGVALVSKNVYRCVSR